MDEHADIFTGMPADPFLAEEQLAQQEYDRALRSTMRLFGAVLMFAIVGFFALVALCLYLIYRGLS